MNVLKNSFLSHSDAALRNRNVILRYIKDNAPVSRTDIWENLDMSRASVTQIMKQFQENGLIVDCFHGVSTGGRKPLYVEFEGSGIIFFSFDWTTKNLYLMNLNGDVLHEIPLQLGERITPEDFSHIIKSKITEVKAKKLCADNEIVGMVLALPGIINANNKKVVFSVELGWQNVDVAELFKDEFSGHIYLERTLNLLSLAEMTLRKKNNKASHLQLFIFDASGIGVSTVIHGNIQHGLSCMHGELGHIKLLSNEPCSCGQKGCLEAVIKKLMRESGGEITGEILEYFSVGISTAVNICDTDVVLTGSYIEQMTDIQKNYLKNAVLNKITSPDMRNFEIDYLSNVKQMAQLGLCTYMFDCCFPT